MKKLLYLTFILPLLAFASCSDDDDIADVDVQMQFSGVTLVDGALYTIQGETVSIDNTTVISQTSENAIIQRVEYFLNGNLILPDPENWLAASFSTSDLHTGKYAIGMRGLVLQVDKTVTAVATETPLIVVNSVEELPENAPEIGTYRITMTTHH